MSKQTLTVRWGILATGGIATTFAKDLSADPRTRGVDAVKHVVVAAASSSSKDRAAQFLKDVHAPADTAKAYGSYTDLVKDPNVDIVYVATPHSHHFQNAMLCLEAGKNVLCEKAFTTNAAQAKALVAKAKEKNLFLMEAVWTRYFPLSHYVRATITSGVLGNIVRVSADNAMQGNPHTEFADGKHRLVNMDLAGGALLDLGIYSLTWLFQTIYLTRPEGERVPPTLCGSSMEKFKTGADLTTSILLRFPPAPSSPSGATTPSTSVSGAVQAIATTSMLYTTDPDGHGSAGPAVRIQGERGELQVYGPIYRPTRTRLVLSQHIPADHASAGGSNNNNNNTDKFSVVLPSAHDTVQEREWRQPGPGKGSGWYNGFGSDMNAEGEGHGMFWEADEAGLALLEGRKESRLESLEESVVVMEVMDAVRRQNGMVYPDNIESVQFPVEL